MPHYRFGKHAPRNDYRTLRFGTYVTAALPDPPASCDVLQRVYEDLGIGDPTRLFPMDGNDTLGDCTIAAVAHAITVYQGLVGKKKTIMKREAVVKLYRHLTGGEDTGLNELDVLNYWRQNSVDRCKILAFVKLDPKNHRHVKQAIQLFGGVYLGFQVQRNCEQEFDARKPWIPGPLTHDGHAVFAVGYDAKSLTVLTWGNTQRATWGWWDECVDEAYAILPPQAAKPGFAAGFDIKQLQADLEAVAD